MKRHGLTILQRRALADASAARGRRGLKKTTAGWTDPDVSFGDYYSASTIHSLFARGILQLYDRGTCAHVTDYGARVHEELLEEEWTAS